MNEIIAEKLKLAETLYTHNDLLSAFRHLTYVLKSEEITKDSESFLKVVYYYSSILSERRKFKYALKALEAGRQIKSISPWKVRTMVLLLVIVDVLKEPYKGLKVFQELDEILEHNPDLRDESYPNALYLGARYCLKLISKGEYFQREFQSIYKRLQTEYRDSYYLLKISFDKAFRIEKNYDESIRLLNEMVNYSFEDENTERAHKSEDYYILSLLYADYRKNATAALAALKNCLRLDPDDANKEHVLILLARLCLQVGEYKEAIGAANRYERIFSKPRKKNTGKLYILRILAQSYKEIGDKSKYHKYMRSIFRLRPFSLLSIPFVPKNVWLYNATFKRLLS